MDKTKLKVPYMQNNKKNSSGIKIFWKQHKFAVINVCFVVFVSGLIYSVARPLVNAIAYKSDEIQKRTIDNELNQAKLEKVTELEDEYKYIENNQQSLEVIFSSEEQVNLIRKLENLAAETGNAIELKVLEDANATDKKTIGKSGKEKKEEPGIKEEITYEKYASLEITLHGSYSDLLKFLHKLENSTQYINVISLKVEKLKEAKAKNSDQFSQVGSIFLPADNTIPEENDKKEKETLKSVVNVIAYLRK